jgi:hypothetical protein
LIFSPPRDGVRICQASIGLDAVDGSVNQRKFAASVTVLICVVLGTRQGAIELAATT